MESLEARLLLAAAYPTGLDQYMLEMVNRARANPTGEAADFGITLNEGPPSEVIQPGARPPLAFNPYLIDAARTHGQWMLATGVFGHTGAGGSDPGDRMAAAGYSFSGSWGWGENIAYRGQSPNPPVPLSTTALLHEDLFVDDDYPGRGHRLNILDADFDEVGVAVVAGMFNGYHALMAVQDFAYCSGNSFLTGVAFDESLEAGDEAEGILCHPGEGLAGVTVTATRHADGAQFTTTTWSSGGYSLALPPGTYTVTGSGGGLGGVVTHSGVVIAGDNVKCDFQPSAAELGLTTPAAPQTVQPGASYGVRWTGGPPGTTVNLWRLGPTGWHVAAQGLSPAAGVYSWNTTGSANGWYVFRADVRSGGVRVSTSMSPSWLCVAPAAPPAAPTGPAGGAVLAARGRWSAAQPPAPAGDEFAFVWARADAAEPSGKASEAIPPTSAAEARAERGETAEGAGQRTTPAPHEAEAPADGESLWTVLLSLDPLTDLAGAELRL